MNSEEKTKVHTLDSLAVKQRAKVIGFLPGAKSYRRKLLALGVTPGVEVTLLRVAPLGDPFEILVRGFTLSVRRAEAAQIEIE